MYTTELHFGEDRNDPEMVILRIEFDWDISPKGKTWLAIHAVRHCGVNIEDVLKEDILPSIVQGCLRIMEQSPPNAQTRARCAKEMAEARAKTPHYAAIMADDVAAIKEAVQTSEYPVLLGQRTPRQVH